MNITDKLMLMKRDFLENIFSSMKSLGTLIYHRHRCLINAFAHLLAGLISYRHRPDKPSIYSTLILKYYSGYKTFCKLLL